MLVYVSVRRSNIPILRYIIPDIIELLIYICGYFDVTELEIYYVTLPTKYKSHNYNNYKEVIIVVRNRELGIILLEKYSRMICDKGECEY